VVKRVHAVSVPDNTLYGKASEVAAEYSRGRLKMDRAGARSLSFALALAGISIVLVRDR